MISAGDSAFDRRRDDFEGSHGRQDRAEVLVAGRPRARCFEKCCRGKLFFITL